jgi:hypothetical protein
MQGDAEKSIDYSDKKELPPPLTGGFFSGSAKKLFKGNPN